MTQSVDTTVTFDEQPGHLQPGRLGVTERSDR
jgi:hypothetical protein